MQQLRGDHIESCPCTASSARMLRPIHVVASRSLYSRRLAFSLPCNDSSRNPSSSKSFFLRFFPPTSAGTYRPQHQQRDRSDRAMAASACSHHSAAPLRQLACVPLFYAPSDTLIPTSAANMITYRRVVTVCLSPSWSAIPRSEDSGVAVDPSS